MYVFQTLALLINSTIKYSSINNIKEKRPKSKKKPRPEPKLFSTFTGKT
ncbi:hypothetical protein HMPREF9413_4060 [Paenibacillus sp. HGF7]|nr:hypothetical protein HMPREF9413_4060 [Paenibacillus sp. HGF7]